MSAHAQSTDLRVLVVHSTSVAIHIYNCTVFFQKNFFSSQQNQINAMSESNDQSSDTGSDINWPLDHPLESTYHEQVLFENVPDQYVKGDDVTVFFTILNDIKVNPDEDQIGLSRVRTFFHPRSARVCGGLNDRSRLFLDRLYEHQRMFSLRPRANHPIDWLGSRSSWNSNVPFDFVARDR